jgi:hypothetical protein
MQLGSTELIAIGIFMVTQVAGLIWFMASTKAGIGSIIEKLNILFKKMDFFEKEYARKEDVSKDTGHIEKRIEFIERKLESMR